jgi:hypothetical protein
MSGAAATTRPAPRWRGDDFPSWLSPMLVRELRQGVQSGGFAWTFVVLQGLMFLLLSWAVTTLGSNPASPMNTAFNVFFWLVVGAVVAVVVPLRAVTSVSSERLGNNLDLVRLTRLSATRIIVGKWLAVVAQAGLIAVAVLPYLVLRYFFGGVNLVRDLQAFGWVVALSMVVAAWAIALSTLVAWARIAAGLLSGGGAFFVWILWMEGALGRVFGFMGVTTQLAILGLLGLYTVALLEFAASRIAPAAENHALRKRSLALAVACLWVGVGGWANQATAIWTMAATFPLVLFWAIEAQLELPTAVQSIYTGFARYGSAGRAAAAIFSPGWASGLVFVVLLVGGCLSGWIVVTTKAAGTGRELVGTTIGAILAAAIVFPLPFVVYLQRLRQGLLLYLLVQLCCFMAFVFVQAVKPPEIRWESSGGWMALLPLPLGSLASYVSLVDTDIGRSFSPVFIAAAGFVVVAVFIAVWWPFWRQHHEIGRLVVEGRRRLRSGAGRQAVFGIPGADLPDAGARA